MTKPKISDAARFIYVIGEDAGPQKIGFSRRPSVRWRQIGWKRYQVHAAVPVAPTEARAIEQYAHYLLREQRLRGEWFDVSIDEAKAAITAAIEAVRCGDTLPAKCKIPLVMREAMADRIDNWRTRHRPLPNRSEALRQLLEKGLKAEGE